jgi:predicted nucleotidyltransferase
VPTFDGLETVVAEQPYPLVFATISGAHLYGFASVDSDVDLRGVHLLPVREMIGLDHGPETVQHMGWRDGFRMT